MPGRAHYSHPQQMEPLLPPLDDTLRNLAMDVVRTSGELSGKLHPITRKSIARLLRNMNSYYSNLIEGNATHPRDIEKALRNKLLKDPGKRALQLESRAHVEVQGLLEERLRANPSENICAVEFLQWIHAEFYSRLPKESLAIKNETGDDLTLVPGELRVNDVVVGNHIPPKWEALPKFLKRYSVAYDHRSLSGTERLVAAAAAHHRLLWIHPFLDGNGRVARLFSHAYMIVCGLDAEGLWTVSRGLSRTRAEYFALLNSADMPRQGDLDGRGNLSARALSGFCGYFLRTMLDQIRFMSTSLDLASLENTIRFYVTSKRFSDGAERLLTALLYRGEIPRGEAGAYLGRKEVRSRQIVKNLIQAGILTSVSPKTPLRLAFPAEIAEIVFPRLFPAA
jgi:Fic family protein